MARYIYEHGNWPQFHWDSAAISGIFGEVRHLQGRLSAQIEALGFQQRSQAALDTLATDVVKSSEIEGELLDRGQVRSSIARRLGLDVAGLVPSDRHVDGVVAMTLDATRNHAQPLTEERLFGWHAALFPTGRSGLSRIEVGRYRTGEMQIVSGAMGRERVHYHAPPADRMKAEMDGFLEWFNTPMGEGMPTDPVLKAAVAHFRFIIIHPFDDGNGRMARALTDLMLARAEGSADRFYSMSSRIMAERKQYYAVLQRAQHSEGDITEWMMWFLHCLRNALLDTDATLHRVTAKADFWKAHEQTPLNERQRLMLNRLLDGFEGKLKTSKWAKMAKCSPDTALRDIKDLIGKGILRQEADGGRSTNYELT